MATTGLQSLDSSIHKTNEWLSQLALDLGVRDKHVAFGTLRVVLATIREVLPLETSAEVVAELPFMVRGIYFEEWAPSREPAPATNVIDRVAQRLDPSMNVEAALRATFVLLDSRLSRNTVAALKRALDDESRLLWPSPTPSSASRVRTSESARPESHPSSRPSSQPSSRRVK